MSKPAPTMACALCGKQFKPNDQPICGGTYNGEPLCSRQSIERDLEKLAQKGAA